MSRKKSLLSILFHMGMLAALAAGLFPVGQPQAALAAPLAAPSAAESLAPAAPTATTNTIALQVSSARTEPYWRENPGTPITDTVGILAGAAILEYDYIINVDNTGDPFQEMYPDCSPYTDATHTISNTTYPANCNYPGIAAVPSNAPIVTQGSHLMLNISDTLTLPDGKYLISVISPDFKIDGQWFTLPMEETTPGSGVAVVNVAMQPYPLPDATIRVKVFEDNSPTNSGPDIPAERGLAGFAGHMADWGGEITTDLYGNPLCTEYYTATNTLHGLMYDADGAPVPIPGSGGECLSDANGDLVIPHVGTNRFEVWVVPPDGTAWAQTTTLEGNKPWDTWVMEGNTGWDTEFVQAGELFPVTIFGFVQPTNLITDTAVTGEIKGVIAGAEVYVPFAGGLPYLGSLWGGLTGSKINNTIDTPWIALADLQGGDTAVWIGRGNTDGSFSIPHVPDGDYFLSWWDDPNLYLLDWMQVSVRNGQVVDMGVLFLTGWFTYVDGHVFIDDNENGKKDPEELGIIEFPVLTRRRENSEMDRGAVLAVTKGGGYYQMENVYPLNQWIILEAYMDAYYTTGVTYKVFNQPEETTFLGAGVDVGIMPVIGQSAWVDWGVKPYAPGTNGGIAGTVFYETTRNELDKRYEAVEPWSMGIPGLTVNLYAPVPCGTTGAACDAEGKYELAADGSFARGAWLNTTTTESWERPKDCIVRDVDGVITDQPLLPPSTGGYDCLESMVLGTQVQTGFATVDGNFGFAEIYSPSITATNSVSMPMPIGDYLVSVESPIDPYTGQPVYQVVREEDVNVFDGAAWVPQIPPPICAGALHEVDVVGIGPGGVITTTFDGPNAVDNPNFVAEGGSPYEGQDFPYCDTKLVTVSEGRSIAPAFNFFTPVPLPGRHWGLILDDLTLATDPLVMTYGEKAGIPNAPIGIYDFTNRLVKVVHSDPHGYFQALLPSTQNINIPSPSGVAAGMFYYVGNDPGQPGALNPMYNPQYRTIATPFEVYPGIGIVADLAPTQIGTSIVSPGSQFNRPTTCQLNVGMPQMFAIDKVVVPVPGTNALRTITITGLDFGATQGNGRVQLGTRTLAITSWSDRQIVARVPSNMPQGLWYLNVQAHNRQKTINGVGVHITGALYNPTVLEVGPGKTYATIQSALEDAAGIARAVVVVYPGTPELWNPTGAYFENIIVHSPVRLQGFGPGGVYSDGSYVPGSIINGLAFAGDANQTAANWRNLMAGLEWVGNQTVYEGAVVSVYPEGENQFTSAYYASIDGFTIEGGNQQGFPGELQQAGVQVILPGPSIIQGGGIFVNGYARFMRVSNNIIRGNGGAYGGAIRLGTPNLPAGDPNKDAQNDGFRIQNNQIIANGGSNLAGGVAIFDGANAYRISFNDICGNFSAEYGGGISHYGYSPNGQIFNNRIYFNRSYDEGGGVMIAGELPAVPGTLSPGSGAVSIYNNIIQGNVANDDGGGLRFLMVGVFPQIVYNNFIVNNVSTHEGGGVSINDATAVLFFNNTVMKNLTTATALTSTGAPAPAGLSTSLNSNALQAILPGTSPTFSNPVLFNNIFWDNRAGSWDGAGVHGLGLTGDPNPIFYWDMGLSDLAFNLTPTNSILSSTLGTALDASNLVGFDPMVVSSYDTSVSVLPWRTNPNFVGVNLIAVDAPPSLMGNYHLQPSLSPAINAGAASKGPVFAPTTDIDGDLRPSSGGYEIGGDEIGPLSILLLVLPGAQEEVGYKVYLPNIGR
ncbi:MAG: IPT/TIG domain-containing protein [Chloroflexi bacterium]|nr:IPT/TIG domain-containing protein [Chloroflexota bacterium]